MGSPLKGFDHDVTVGIRSLPINLTKNNRQTLPGMAESAVLEVRIGHDQDIFRSPPLSDGGRHFTSTVQAHRHSRRQAIGRHEDVPRVQRSTERLHTQCRRADCRTGLFPACRQQPGRCSRLIHRAGSQMLPIHAEYLAVTVVLAVTPYFSPATFHRGLGHVTTAIVCCVPTFKCGHAFAAVIAAKCWR